MNKKKILLVDDDIDFVHAQGILLENLGYEITSAKSGKEGYEKIQNETPDLVILDVDMEKEFSGFELHRKIRETKNLIGIPIIILTGIETYHVSNKIIEMYRSMRGNNDFEMNRVLRISDYESDVAVEYYDINGKAIYLLLDSFISKVHVHDKLINEIKKFI